MNLFSRCPSGAQYLPVQAVKSPFTPWSKYMLRIGNHFTRIVFPVRLRGVGEYSLEDNFFNLLSFQTGDNMDPSSLILYLSSIILHHP